MQPKVFKATSRQVSVSVPGRMSRLILIVAHNSTITKSSHVKAIVTWLINNSWIKIELICNTRASYLYVNITTCSHWSMLTLERIYTDKFVVDSPYSWSHSTLRDHPALASTRQGPAQPWPGHQLQTPPHLEAHEVHLQWHAVRDAHPRVRLVRYNCQQVGIMSPGGCCNS